MCRLYSYVCILYLRGTQNILGMYWCAILSVACWSICNVVRRDSSSRLVWLKWPGPRFTNEFSIAIQIRWKFRFSLTSTLILWSLQNFIHGTTAVLSWHVQKFVAIWRPAAELWQGEVSIVFELRAKTVSETGPWSHFTDIIPSLCKISFYHHSNSERVIGTTSRPQHDNCAVVACTIFSSGLINQHGVTTKHICHRIWIAMARALVKWTHSFNIVSGRRKGVKSHGNKSHGRVFCISTRSLCFKWSFGSYTLIQTISCPWNEMFSAL